MKKTYKSSFSIIKLLFIHNSVIGIINLKLYKLKYLKYKSKYLKYIEDNKIQKGGAKYRVLVKKINPIPGQKLLLEIVLWDEDAPAYLKYQSLLKEDSYKNNCMCVRNAYSDETEQQINLDKSCFPQFTKLSYEDQKTFDANINYRISKYQSVMRDAFIMAKSSLMDVSNKSVDLSLLIR